MAHCTVYSQIFYPVKVEPIILTIVDAFLVSLS
jgi:hypothetical protein